jgi:uncharacterized protein YjbI with pentapeptide repeats
MAGDQEDENEQREQARVLRLNAAEDRRTRSRRYLTGFITIIGLFGVGLGAYQGLLVFQQNAEQFKNQSKLTRELFQKEMKLNRSAFKEQKVAFDAERLAFKEEAADRNNARMVRAWQLLRDSKGASRNIGQITALETLYRGEENLHNVDFGCAKAPVGEADTEDEYLTDEIGDCMFFANIDLTIKNGQNPHAADLTGANLIRANLNKALLVKTVLNSAKLVRANLWSADLGGATLKFANLADAVLNGANLTKADLYRARFLGAKLRGANLSGANLKEASFIGADLERAHLRGADLSGASFFDANLKSTLLQEANLSGTDFIKAKGLTQKKLDIACVDKDGKPPVLPIGLTSPTRICTKD